MSQGTACLNSQINRGWCLQTPCCWLGTRMNNSYLLVRPMCRGCCDLITTACRWRGGFPRQPQCIQRLQKKPDFILPSLCWCKVTFAEVSSFSSFFFFFTFPTVSSESGQNAHMVQFAIPPLTMLQMCWFTQTDFCYHWAHKLSNPFNTK